MIEYCELVRKYGLEREYALLTPDQRAKLVQADLLVQDKDVHNALFSDVENRQHELEKLEVLRQYLRDCDEHNQRLKSILSTEEERFAALAGVIKRNIEKEVKRK